MLRGPQTSVVGKIEHQLFSDHVQVAAGQRGQHGERVAGLVPLWTTAGRQFACVGGKKPSFLKLFLIFASSFFFFGACLLENFFDLCFFFPCYSFLPRIMPTGYFSAMTLRPPDRRNTFSTPRCTMTVAALMAMLSSSSYTTSNLSGCQPKKRQLVLRPKDRTNLVHIGKNLGREVVLSP